MSESLGHDEFESLPQSHSPVLHQKDREQDPLVSWTAAMSESTEIEGFVFKLLKSNDSNENILQSEPGILGWKVTAAR